MKKSFKPLTIIATLLFTNFSIYASGQNLDEPKGIPAFITNAIQKMKSDEVKTPPRSVWQYEYNGKTVYYFPPYCCDVPGQLFDSNGKEICSPDGGMVGEGDSQCYDFSKLKKKQKLIWKDDRKIGRQ